MSLVGNLADLGLGDILQIISLSQKSGTLQLATSTDAGHIAFVSGKVVGALREQHVLTVSEELVAKGLVSATVMFELIQLQTTKPTSAPAQPPAIWEAHGVSIDAVEAAMKAQIEAIVYEMFLWEEGNFSFVVADDARELSRLVLSSNNFVVMRGLNPQFLAMEGTRLRDEAKRDDKPKPSAKVDTPAFEAPAFEPPVAAAPVPVVLEKPKQRPVARAAPKEEVASEGQLEVVLIDDDPTLLRALRERLLTVVPAVNVFTKVDAGLKRTRELLWANKPVVVVTDLIIPRSDGAGILGGLEVLEKIRPDYPEVPVYVLTDYPNEEARERALKLNVSGMVTKPRRAELEKDKSRAVLEPTVVELVALLGTRSADVGSDRTERIAPISRSIQVEPTPEPPASDPTEAAEREAVEREAERARKREEILDRMDATERIAPIQRSVPVEALAVPEPEESTPFDSPAFTQAVELPTPLATAEVDGDEIPVASDETDFFAEEPPRVARGVASQPLEPEPTADTARDDQFGDLELDAVTARDAAEDGVSPGAASAVAVAPPDESFDVSFDDELPELAVEAAPVEPAAAAPLLPSVTLPAVDPFGPAEANADPALLLTLSREIGLELGVTPLSFGEGGAPQTEQERTMMVLKSLLFELMSPASRDTIMLLVLRYASELFARSVLLLVAREELWGLGGFSHGVRNVDFIALSRKLRVKLDAGGVFAQVIDTKSSTRAPLDKSQAEREFAEKLGIDPEQEVYVAPILSGDRVVAILLGDSQQLGQHLRETQGLEIFLLQAGMAMERALLERRLRELGRE